MSWIVRDYLNNELKLEPNKTDLDIFVIVKTRSKNTCACCNKKLPSKSWVYGTGWTRLCLDCGEAFMNKAIKGFENIIKEIKTSKQYHKMNKEKWTAENTLANL